MYVYIVYIFSVCVCVYDMDGHSLDQYPGDFKLLITLLPFHPTHPCTP